VTWLHLKMVRSDKNIEPIYVNSDHIVYIRASDYNGGQSYIQTVNIMPDDCWFNVKESPHEILSQIPCP